MINKGGKKMTVAQWQVNQGRTRHYAGNRGTGCHLFFNLRKDQQLQQNKTVWGKTFCTSDFYNTELCLSQSMRNPPDNTFTDNMGHCRLSSNRPTDNFFWQIQNIALKFMKNWEHIFKHPMHILQKMLLLRLVFHF